MPSRLPVSRLGGAGQARLDGCWKLARLASGGTTVTGVALVWTAASGQATDLLTYAAMGCPSRLDDVGLGGAGPCADCRRELMLHTLTAARRTSASKVCM